MTSRRRWRVRLTATAESNFRYILGWSAAWLGHAQARIHSETPIHAIQTLPDGPHVAGSRQRDDIAEGPMILHVARAGGRGRHFVPYRSAGSSEPPGVDVLRLLHELMDLARRVGSGGDGASRIASIR